MKNIIILTLGTRGYHITNMCLDCIIMTHLQVLKLELDKEPEVIILQRN